MSLLSSQARKEKETPISTQPFIFYAIFFPNEERSCLEIQIPSIDGTSQIQKAHWTTRGRIGVYFPFDDNFTLVRPLVRRIEPVSALVFCILIYIPPMFRSGGVRKDVGFDRAKLVAAGRRKLVDGRGQVGHNAWRSARKVLHVGLLEALGFLVVLHFGSSDSSSVYRLTSCKRRTKVGG